VIEQNGNPDWAHEIRRLKRRIDKIESQKDLIVFYGSSSIRLWVRMKIDLWPYNVLNLGLGGSTFEWCNFYFEELFNQISPKEIILYGGDNDLSNDSIDRAIINLNKLIDRIYKKYGKIKVSVISVKPSPARTYLEPQILKFNTSLRNIAEEIDNGHFINIHSLMLNEEKEANPNLFLSDQLHMNRNGYEIWKNALLNHLKKKSF